MVEIEHVTKIYKLNDKEKNPNGLATKALDDVSTVIQDGEFTAFAGPSGSGKTTILNLIGCLDTMTEGKIILDGQDISLMSKKQKNILRKEKIGFIFQSYNLIPVLTAQENVELALSLLNKYSKEEKKQMAHDILAEVGLDGLQNRKPHQLSGGQQQRISVARALVKKPSVILADEPTANLDSVNAIKIIEMMQMMNLKYNTTFIFSTHDRMVMDHCRRLIHIKDGKLLD
ncbi:MAG: ABC transporter ATP-binding protein [Treponemataceae bacterium]|nr:ABC transporter ATP-binding protein [Treponemataceae bacterium]